MARHLAPWSGGRSLGFEPLFDLHREMNRLFDDVFRGGTLADVRGTGMVSVPRIDMRESDGELCVVAELPGVTQSELDLQLDGDMLTISGEKKQEHEEEKANYYMMERSYGRFQRSVQLPFAPNPDQVKADFENGVLTIHMPNQGKDQRVKHIAVSGQGSGSKQQPAVGSKQSSGSGSASASSGASGSKQQ